MANSVFKILRSLTAGARPAGQTYGTPYVNMADNQYGVVDSSNVPRDLIGVPFYNPGAMYPSGSPVNYQGQIIVSIVNVGPGTFNPLQWTPVTKQSEHAGGFINKFRNNTYDWWQRGAGPTVPAGNPSSVMGPDGWYIIGWSSGGFGTGKAQPGPNSLNTLQLYGNAGVTDSQVSQRIESIVASGLGGVNCTAQIKVYNQTGTTFTPQIRIIHPNTTDNYSAFTQDLALTDMQPCPNGAWTTIAYTFNVPKASANLGLAIYFGMRGANNASGRNIYIAEADVRQTPFLPVGLCQFPPATEMRAPDVEWTNISRYMQTFTCTWSGGNVGAGGVYYQWGMFVPPLRATPTIIVTQGSPGAGGSGFGANPATFLNITNTSWEMYATATTTIPGGAYYWASIQAAAEF